MTKPGRIACCVPYCRRTAKDDGVEGQEVICGKHWRSADRDLCRRYKKLCRELGPLMDRPPEEYPEAKRNEIIAKYHSANDMWQQIKKQAIEAAMGIG